MKKVRGRRKKLGLRLKKAVERAKMHWQRWQMVEAGTLDITMWRLEAALGIAPRELIHA